MKKILIEGIIGWDINASFVRKLLDEANEEEITVEIASPGGFVYDGLTIFNLIKDYSRNVNKVTTKISGLAASMASYIAMAGDKVIAEDASVFVIHNVQAIVVGDYREMEKQADHAERLTDLLATAYCKKSKKSKKEIRALMDDETFYYGKESVDAGFVDEIIKTNKQGEKSVNVGLAQEQIKNCFIQMKESEKAKTDIRKAASTFPDIFTIKNEKNTEQEINSKSESTKTEINNKHIQEEKKNMTALELKAQSPDIYNEIYNLGVESVGLKLKNIKAHLQYKDVAPERVFTAIEKEEPFDMVSQAEYGKLQTNKILQKTRESEDPKNLNTVNENTSITAEDTEKAYQKYQAQYGKKGGK